MTNILVVDDERIIRDSMQFLLEARDEFEVRTAAGVKEALDAVKVFVPDLLIVDWMLGDNVDGLQLIEMFRQDHPRLPAILVTGYMSPEIQERIVDMANTWGLTKLCEFDELLQTIHEALDANLATRRTGSLPQQDEPIQE